MHRLSRLGEDVGILRRGENAVEVGLAEAFADGEDVFGGVGGGEGELVGGDADHGTCSGKERCQPVGGHSLTLQATSGIGPSIPYFWCISMWSLSVCPDHVLQTCIPKELVPDLYGAVGWRVETVKLPFHIRLPDAMKGPG